MRGGRAAGAIMVCAPAARTPNPVTDRSNALLGGAIVAILSSHFVLRKQSE